MTTVLSFLLAAAFVAVLTAAECSYFTTPVQCNLVSTCDWRWNTNSCRPSCAVEYDDDIGDCCLDDACEWYPAPNATQCRDRCASLETGAQCKLDNSCTWSRVNEWCESSCGRYGNESICNTDPRCMWNGTTCITDPNPPTTLVNFAFVAPTPLALSMMNLSWGWQSSFTLAVQADLMAAYGSRVIVNPTWTIDSRAQTLGGSYYCATDNLPALMTNSANETAMWHHMIVVGNAAGILPPQTDVSVAYARVTGPSVPDDTLTSGQIALIAVGTIVVVGVLSAGVAVFAYRRNPYATAAQGVTPAASFSEDEYERLKAANEHTLTYGEASAIQQRWDATHGAAGANEGLSRCPVVAKCEMPKKYHRNQDIRAAWAALSSNLFPPAFEYLTHIRIAFDDAGYIRCHASKARQVLQYNSALRMVIQPQRNSVDIVLLGAARFLVVVPSDAADDVNAIDVPAIRADTPDLCNVVKGGFDQSRLCSHTGAIGARKIAMGRLVPVPSFIVPTSPNDRSPEVNLIGAPPCWHGDVVETAVKLMIRIGCTYLVEGEGAQQSLADPFVRVQPGGDIGGWRIQVTPPQALGVLVAVSCRFWGLQGDVLCCQCTSGIAITPASDITSTTAGESAVPNDVEMRPI